jgi:hypothetical protein
MAQIKKISTELQLLDKFLDTSGDAGTSGQVLTSTGTGINWVSGGSLPGGPYLPLAGGRMTTTAKIEFYNANQYIHALSFNDLDIVADDDINYRSNFSRFFSGTTEHCRVSGLSNQNNWIANGSGCKLGVNITAPLDTLHVDGGVVIQNGNNLQWGGLYSNSNPTIYASTNYIVLVPTGVTGASSRMLYLDEVGLGVGKSSPTVKLDVAGTTKLGGNLYVSTDANFNTSASYTFRDGVYINNPNSTSAAVASGNVMSIGASSGNGAFTSLITTGAIGIGATAPSNLLTLKGSGQNWNTSPAIKIWDSHNSKGWYVGSANNQATGDFYIRSVTSEPSYPVAANQEFTIKQTGRVGIGTINPGTKLDVRGTGYFLGTATSGAALVTIENNSGSTATSYGLLVIGGGNSSNGRTFEVRDASGNPDLIVKGNGNVGIGVTGPSEKLEVTGNFKLNGTFVQEGTGNNLTFKYRTANSSAYTGGNATCKFGRFYWTPAHWVTGAPVIKVTLQCKYYQGEQRQYIIKAGYQDTDPIINELQPSSTSQRITLLVGATTSAGYNYAGQPVYYVDLQWVQSSYMWGWAQIESQVGFLTSNPTSGWGGVVLDSGVTQTNNSGALQEYNSFFNGKVGIGTSNPATGLHLSNSNAVLTIQSTQNGQNCSTWYKANGNNQWETGCNIGAGTDYQIYDRLNSASRMVVGHDGNVIIPGKVGIGTTSPNHKLQVEGGSAESIINLTTTGYANGLDIIEGTDGHAAVWLRENSYMHFGTNGVERMRITSGGNVGIGNTSPDKLLHVGNGLAQLGSPQGAEIEGYNNTLDVKTNEGNNISDFTAAINLFCDGVVGSSGTGTGIYFRAKTGAGGGGEYTKGRIQGAVYTSWTTNTDATRTSKLVIQTTNNGIHADRVTILGNGDFGINDTSPSNKLDVNGDIRGTQYKLRGNVSNPTNTAATIYDQSGVGLTLSAHNVELRNYNGSAMVRSVFFTHNSATFTGTCTATNFILSSDETLKDDIKDIDNKHIDVSWKNFELKSEPGIKRVGVIAQELEAKHPEFVRTNEDGLKSVAYVDLLIAKIAELEARLEKAGI